MLQGWRGWVKLGVEGQRVGRAVSGSRADGANSFCRGLHGYRRTFVETILFTSEEERAQWVVKKLAEG